jgi:hypothetical protein
MNTPRFPKTSSSLASLGGLIETFPLSKGRRWAWLVAALILLAAAAGVKIYGITLTYLGWMHYGAAVVGELLFWPLVVAVGLFLLSLIPAGIAYANWVKALMLYQNGFAYKNRLGLHLWHWSDVVVLRMAVTRYDILGLHTGTNHVYTVENRDGKRLVLNDSFRSVEGLARAIEDNTFPSLFEQASQQYNAGGNLAFGPVKVSKAGIQIGRKSYAWGEVQQISIQQGNLQVVKKGGGWFSGAHAASATIPNLRVLLSLISQVVRVEVGEQQ